MSPDPFLDASPFRARRDARRSLVDGAGAGDRPDQGRPDAAVQRHLRLARQHDRERLQALRAGARRQARRARDPVLQGRRRVGAFQGHRQRQQADQARQRRRAGRHRAFGRRARDGQGGQGQQHAADHPERRRRRDHRPDVRHEHRAQFVLELAARLCDGQGRGREGQQARDHDHLELRGRRRDRRRASPKASRRAAARSSRT